MTLKQLKIGWIALLLLPATGLAQDLVPATSEDLEMFDRHLSESLEKEKSQAPSEHGNKKKDKADKENFGQVVSSEAKRLREENRAGGKEFGQWVSSQRRKDEQKRPDTAGGTGASGSNGAGAGAAADARNDSRGNAAGADAAGRSRGPKKEK